MHAQTESVNAYVRAYTHTRTTSTHDETYTHAQTRKFICISHTHTHVNTTRNSVTKRRDWHDGPLVSLGIDRSERDVYAYVYACVHANAYVYVCLSVCVRVCVYVCMCMGTCVHVCVCGCSRVRIDGREWQGWCEVQCPRIIPLSGASRSLLQPYTVLPQ